MANKAEQYFLGEIASQVTRPSDVLAMGYFRTHIRDRWGQRQVSVFEDAAHALGHFLALAEDKLLVVKTRAPATSSPLLENKGVSVIPLSRIRRVTFDTDLLLIESDIETLALQLTLTNKHFPSQEKLLAQLAARFNASDSVASVRAAQQRKRWLKLGIWAAALLAGILWALLKQ